MDYRTKDEKLAESVRFANEGADAQESLEERLLAGEVGFENFIYATQAGESYLVSAALLESIGNFPRAQIFYDMSSRLLLTAMDVLEENECNSREEYVDVFWNASDSYRDAVNGFRRVEEIVVRRQTKYETDDGSGMISINIGEMC